MAAHLLANYLKTHRKRSGLFQRDVALVLGWKNAEQYARYERRNRLPSLRAALALAAIFKVPVTELFAGVNDSVIRDTEARIETLAGELQKKADRSRRNGARLAATRLSWLRAHHGRPVSAHQ